MKCPLCGMDMEEIPVNKGNVRSRYICKHPKRKVKESRGRILYYQREREINESKLESGSGK